jgi:hypothetical protein
MKENMELNEWISVKKRLPELGKHVFVTGVPDEKYCKVSKRRDVWIDKRVQPDEHTDGLGFLKIGGHGHFAITHWLPIPKIDGQEIFETLPVE